MKKVIGVFIALLLLAAVGCEREQPEVMYDFQFSASSSALKSAAAHSIDDAVQIVISIESALTTTQYTDAVLPLLKFSGSYLSPHLRLLGGNYKLTKFLLIDEKGNVLYGVPTAGSNLDSLVVNSLPYDFQLPWGGGLLPIDIEVISTLGYDPADFGLGTFGLSEVVSDTVTVSFVPHDYGYDLRHTLSGWPEIPYIGLTDNPWLRMTLTNEEFESVSLQNGDDLGGFNTFTMEVPNGDSWMLNATVIAWDSLIELGNAFYKYGATYKGHFDYWPYGQATPSQYYDINQTQNILNFDLLQTSHILMFRDPENHIDFITGDQNPESGVQKEAMAVVEDVSYIYHGNYLTYIHLNDGSIWATDLAPYVAEIEIEDRALYWTRYEYWNELLPITSYVDIPSSTVTMSYGGEGMDQIYNLTLISGPIDPPNTVTDIDGNVYPTVDIGTQTWMAENLRVTKYNNGVPINYEPVRLDWIDASLEGRYCYYQNQPENQELYGNLYNWYAATYQGDLITPEGWHLPTKAEWQTLIDYLGGYQIAGGKLKEIGFVNWDLPNEAATDEVGFTALPAGYRTDYNIDNEGTNNYYQEGKSALFWASTYLYTNSADAVLLGYLDADANINLKSRKFGASIRLIKD